MELTRKAVNQLYVERGPLEFRLFDEANPIPEDAKEYFSKEGQLYVPNSKLRLKEQSGINVDVYTEVGPMGNVHQLNAMDTTPSHLIALGVVTNGAITQETSYLREGQILCNYAFGILEIAESLITMHSINIEDNPDDAIHEAISGKKDFCVSFEDQEEVMKSLLQYNRFHADSMLRQSKRSYQ